VWPNNRADDLVQTEARSGASDESDERSIISSFILTSPHRPVSDPDLKLGRRHSALPIVRFRSFLCVCTAVVVAVHHTEQQRVLTRKRPTKLGLGAGLIMSLLHSFGQGKYWLHYCVF